MKTRKLRILSALLALAMLFALMPTAAFAADDPSTSGKCGAKGNEENVTWKLENDTLTISGSGAMADYEKSSDQPWADQRSNIKHLVVENGVTSIGNNAFRDCTKLIDADMSKALSLETIGTSFWGCKGLKSVKLNEGLKEIGGSAFSKCTILGSIDIPSTVTNIGSWCFQECSGLENVTFEDGINLTTIETGTFTKCTNLKKITIPKSVKVIQTYDNYGGIRGAFSMCSGLESVIFEPGSELETVERGAFNNCADNMKIYYSDSNVKNALSGKVGSEKMVECVKVTFDPNNGGKVEAKMVEKGQKAAPPADPPTRADWDFVGWYTKNADGKWADEKFDFSKAITDDMTLYARWTVSGKCGNNLTWILDSDGTLTISGSGEMADYNSLDDQPWAKQRNSINKVVIGDGVKSIGGSAFANCPSLETVELPQNGALETIKENAFSWLDPSSKVGAGITEITIPASVKTIEKCAFDGCTKLATVIFAKGSQLNVVGHDVFRNCSDVTIYYSDETVKTVLIEGGVDANKIKPLTPTVTFVSNGGSNVEPATVKNGEKISAPDAPTREGWNFAGWYTKDASGNWAKKPFDFINTAIMDNMILYARWETKLVNITPAAELYPIAVDCGTAYDAEGNPIEKAAAGDVVTIKADETAFDGMAFERWEVRKGEVQLKNDRAAETAFTMPAGEVQLEAMPRLESPDDSGWDAATVVTGAVIGTGTAILAYHIGMEVYAEQVLGKGVAVPRTRGEVALLAWQLAGSPAVNGKGEPLSEAAQAERWAVESGLMQPDAEGNFNGTKKMSKWNALRVLDAAKKQG